MAISALDVGRFADALVQVMRSDATLDDARAIIADIPAEDRPVVARAFAARAWEDEGEPVPKRGALIQDLFAEMRDRP